MTVNDLLQYLRDNDVPGDAALVIGRWPKRIGERAQDEGVSRLCGKRAVTEFSVSDGGAELAILYVEPGR